MSETKRCRSCGIEKPIGAFYGDTAAKDGHRPECKDCTSTRRQAWYRANRDREVERVTKWQRDNAERYAQRQREYAESGRKKIADRKSHLKRKYGLTVEQYDAMLEAQGGVCAICGEKPGDLTLHVDHHHETGAVRKLLCVRCNNALGLFQESHELFQAAADYLHGHDPEFIELVELAQERAHALAQPV